MSQRPAHVCTTTLKDTGWIKKDACINSCITVYNKTKSFSKKGHAVLSSAEQQSILWQSLGVATSARPVGSTIHPLAKPGGCDLLLDGTQDRFIRVSSSAKLDVRTLTVTSKTLTRSFKLWISAVWSICGCSAHCGTIADRLGGGGGCSSSSLVGRKTRGGGGGGGRS